MTLWTADAAARATGGVNTQDWQASGVSIDTRSLQPGDLFVALSDQRDGHDFVAQALAKGAAAALVSHRPADVAQDAPLLVVDDVLTGLEALGIAARARTDAKVIAVTGSVGKTGSKEMLRSALGAQGRVHAAEKSYNNHWGVPLTLARMPADTEFAVIEIGMNAPGEIAPLARFSRPHVALITTVAAVHLAAFENVDGIAREKASIMKGLEPGGTVVLNRDLDCFEILSDAAVAAEAQIVTFGTADTADFQLLRVSICENGTTAAAKSGLEEFFYKISAPGRHLACNALGVLAGVSALSADLAQAILALGTWEPPEGRGARWDISLGAGGIDGTVRLIDESYNANPASMAATFEVLTNIPLTHKPGRRIAFLADMLELGDTAKELHIGLAKLPQMADIDLVHAAGPMMKALMGALPEEKRGEWHEDTKKLAMRVPRLVDAGDIVMAKGSLGSKVAVIVTAIKEMGDPHPHQTSGEID